MLSTVSIIGIILYSFVFLLLLLGTIRICQFRRFIQFPSKFQLQFYILLLCFLIIRIIWIVLNDRENRVLTFGLNRFAILSFFTNFTYLIFYWAEIYHDLSSLSNHFSLSRLLKPFIFANLILYLFTIEQIIEFSIDDKNTKETDTVYTVGVLVVGGSSFFAAFGFLIYGILLFCKYKNTVSFVLQRRKALNKIATIATIFSICFLSRFIMLLYYPITHKYFAEGIYMTFSYYIPEVIPSVVQLYSMHPKIPKNFQKYGSKFSDNLMTGFEIPENLIAQKQESLMSDENSDGVTSSEKEN
ncbi:tobamovirus multiplication protein 1-like isoform x1 [Anaeramoeba ignava]|uniref:Tobamovirus multiplication protein 1-like isoform x1 n=1 Tax=Anaeramoeba ignava TaxID=1746090 RepID=A0A9Q0LK30_ANAIG|nr:tobamovirus multiplication protein 1-like isoform x1 [Anaeramoeba ignava]